MANGAIKTTKTGRRKQRPVSRKAGAPSSRRAKAPAPNPKQQGPGTRNADPQTNYQHYMKLARDAASAGDAVQSEHYYQYADHYHRLLAQD